MTSAEMALALQDRINELVAIQAEVIQALCEKYIKLLTDPVIHVRFDGQGAVIEHTPSSTDLCRVNIEGFVNEQDEVGQRVIYIPICSRTKLESLCELSVLPEHLH